MTFTEQEPHHTEPLESFKDSYLERPGKILTVEANLVAAEDWQRLVDLTQADQRERGIAIGRRGTKLLHSGIIEGSGKETDYYDNPAAVLEPTFPVPMLPFGLKGLLPKVEKIAILHTHPMPPEINHVKTTVISDKDIYAFLHTGYRAMLMADRGGAHLLTRTSPSVIEVSLSPNLVSKTISDVIRAGGGSMDVLERVARRLSQLGLGYFYTPDLSPKNGTVEFHNLVLANQI
jgi:hypothetical protein